MYQPTLCGSLTGLLLFGSWLGLSAHQDLVEQTNDAYIYGRLKHYDTARPIPDAAVIITTDGKPPVTIAVSDSGKYEVALLMGSVYSLRYEAPGFVAKYVEIDLRNIPEAEQAGGFGMNVEMTLFPFLKGVDLSFLREPIGKARYVAADTNLVWDLAYTERIRSRIADAMKQYDSLRVARAAQANRLPGSGVDAEEEAVQWQRYGMFAGAVVGVGAVLAWLLWRQRRHARRRS